MSASGKTGPATAESDIRPVVALQRRDRSPWIFAGLAAIAALLLFLALDSRRRALTASEQPAPLVAGAGEVVPDLVLPPEAAPDTLRSGPWLTPEMVARRVAPAASQAPPPATRVPAREVVQPQVITNPTPTYYPPPPLLVSQSADSAIPGVSAPSEPQTQTQGKGGPSQRITAARLENPSETVPQGTLIGAVLETGLDSTGAGMARALVTRDVLGFDGTRLLIPRGSRLYGTYEAGIDQGQKRAQIRWTRLLRPDGVTIALDSPAADPLGRAGVKGKVDSHFGARLGNALLSSTVGFGNALLSRRVSPVVVVPGAGGAIPTPQTQDTQIRPTLHIKPGARVSVFVQHDLDFSTVDDGQP